VPARRRSLLHEGLGQGVTITTRLMASLAGGIAAEPPRRIRDRASSMSATLSGLKN